MRLATVLSIFFGNGGGVPSRVWVRSDSGTYNYDVHDLNEARRYQPGMEILINVENGRATPAEII